MDCQTAFDDLKHRLTSAPVLAFPQTDGEFVLDTHASGTGIGAVLSQVQDDERVCHMPVKLCLNHSVDIALHTVSC